MENKNIKDIRIFIGPMSKNIVDSIIEYVNDTGIHIGIIPSRRQIENDGGYVNNWMTKDFCNYVRSKTNNILLVRDHCGPNQGSSEDDGMESFKEDCKYFDVIHVDVWKKHKDYESGLKYTIDFINAGFQQNNSILFEVGTEESIRNFSVEDLDNLLSDLKKNLSEEVFKNVKYAVIQSGTSLLGNTNTGVYNDDRLLKMVEVCNKYNIISKEHNGDYISNDILLDKFKKGLNSINVAPEFGQIETKTLLDSMVDREDIIEEFYRICLESKKWCKWVSEDFIPDDNKIELINISGHYVFSDSRFLNIKRQLDSNIDDKIKLNIKYKIEEMLKHSKIKD